MTEREVLDVRFSEHCGSSGSRRTARDHLDVWVRLFNKAAGDVPLGYGEAVGDALCSGHRPASP